MLAKTSGAGAERSNHMPDQSGRYIAQFFCRAIFNCFANSIVLVTFSTVDLLCQHEPSLWSVLAAGGASGRPDAVPRAGAAASPSSAYEVDFRALRVERFANSFQTFCFSPLTPCRL